MAGSKETPRQKMVGLMYLVLLALLAIQVSSAIVYKFQFLNSSLESFVKDSEEKNNQKLSSIAKQVDLRGSRPAEIKLKILSADITKQSDSLLRYIENLKNELINKTGGYEDNGNLKGAQEETQVEELMLGSAPGKGKAYDLKIKLDKYIKYINLTGTIAAAPMALDGKEHSIFKRNPEQQVKDFAELNFGQTPLVAGIATLSEFQSRISTIKTASLTVISERIGAEDYAIDKLIPMASPASRVVVAGTKYEAQIFMAATSSSQKLKMKAEGKELDVDDSGIGRLAFTASGGNYDKNGFIKKIWKGDITVKQPNGRDTTYPVSEEYFVAKPMIQVQSATVKSLYRNCGNVLDVQVPALGAAYNPVFTVTGGAMEVGNKKGLVTLIPTNAQSSIKVSSGGVFIGEENYRVKLIPTPRIEARVKNSAINPLKGTDKGDLRFLSLKVIPDKEFAETLPKDARYYIYSWKATLARFRKVIKHAEFKGENPNMLQFASEAMSGDRLVIEVTKLQRKNYQDKVEEVKMNEIIVVPIN